MGLNIDLINGTELVEISLDYLETKSEPVTVLNAIPQV